MNANVQRQLFPRFAVDWGYPVIKSEPANNESSVEGASVAVSVREPPTAMGRVFTAGAPLQNPSETITAAAMVRRDAATGRYRCHFCSYKAKFPSMIIRHVRCHLGEKPFKCYECNYASAEKSNLNRHLRRFH